MANCSLLPVYKALFGKEFNYYDFDDRMQMQKAVYLLQDLGVPVGDYSFRWYLHGPYSQKLQDDMYDEREGETGELDLPEEFRDSIRQLMEAIHYWSEEGRTEEEGYKLVDWVECLGSMHYLRKRVLRSSASDQDIIDKLCEKKKHLQNTGANEAALACLKELFAV